MYKLKNASRTQGFASSNDQIGNELHWQSDRIDLKLLLAD